MELTWEVRRWAIFLHTMGVMMVAHPMRPEDEDSGERIRAWALVLVLASYKAEFFKASEA